MGGIVSNLWKKTNPVPTIAGSGLEGVGAVEEEKKSDEDEKGEEKLGDETAQPSSMKGDLVTMMRSEVDESGNDMSNSKPKEPEKPLDLIYSLDLYSNPTTIMNQIREHFHQLKNLSEEMRVTFLSQPEKSYVSKKKIKIKKLIFQPAVHLKELKHKWLRHFETHLSSFPASEVICLDLNFHQLTSFKVFRPLNLTHSPHLPLPLRSKSSQSI
jgi:hypothetical protein